MSNVTNWMFNISFSKYYRYIFAVIIIGKETRVTRENKQLVIDGPTSGTDCI